MRDINRYSEAHIQARTKSTTSFGSRLVGLVAIGACYFMILTLHVSAGTLFAWLGIFPLIGAAVCFMGWSTERSIRAQELAKETG